MYALEATTVLVGEALIFAGPQERRMAEQLEDLWLFTDLR